MEVENTDPATVGVGALAAGTDGVARIVRRGAWRSASIRSSSFRKSEVSSGRTAVSPAPI